MKYPLLSFPTLLPFLMAALMAMEAGIARNADAPAVREAQIRAMHEQIHTSEAKLLALEAEGHNFLPR